MSLKKKLIALGFSAAVLLTSSSTFALTIQPIVLSGTNTDSGYNNLGADTHYLKGTGQYLNGTLYAKKIIRLWPDETVTSFSIKAEESKKAAFTAESHNDDGEVQSYYIHWAGSSTQARVLAEISHTP